MTELIGKEEREIIAWRLDILTQSIREMNDRLFQMESIVRADAILNQYQRMHQSLQKTEFSILDNAKRLDTMMKELRGLIAMVRPGAAKNSWYQTDKELPGQIVKKEESNLVIE